MVAPLIHWIARAPDLYEARVVRPDGRDVFAGYVAASPGQGIWRGDVGADFSPVDMGPRAVMERAVEQRVADILKDDGTGQQLAAFVDGDDQRDSG